jgi:hypothetical protein
VEARMRLEGGILMNSHNFQLVRESSHATWDKNVNEIKSKPGDNERSLGENVNVSGSSSGSHNFHFLVLEKHFSTH